MRSVPVQLSATRWRALSSTSVPPKDPSTGSNKLMPTRGPLVDRFGRVHDDLRISVTDRCNLRCRYCMPTNDMQFLPRSALLSFDEILRVAEVARAAGVTSIRITGGEPLVRSHLSHLVAGLNRLGIVDLSLTTNGMLLEPLAYELRSAGLQRVNFSCDSLRAERFASIRRRGNLATVMRAMTAAETVGLSPIKVNVVLIRHLNDDEILDFAHFARETGRIVRFIEVMPLDSGGDWSRQQLVPGHEVIDRISEKWPLSAVDEEPTNSPANRFRFGDGRGEIGVISSVTQPFCGTCSRLRLTAEGSLRNCLFSDAERPISALLRNQASEDELELAIREAVWGKHAGHQINEQGFRRPMRSMSMIGG
jgi:cyclic pyranopterin phosphate synthase